MTSPLDELMKSTRRMMSRRAPPALSAAPAPSRPRCDPIALGIVNSARVRAGEPPLTVLPDLGPVQPRAEKIDAAATAAAIVKAGKIARAEIPTPLPSDATARAFVLAGLRARGIEVTDG
jgi:hypothetical protein